MANSVIGFHTSVGGNKTGTGAWITNANSKGIQVGIKGVSDYGLLFEAIQTGNQYGVDNWLVYRLSAKAGSVSREVPNYTVDPVIDAEALASEVLSKLPPEFDKTKVWIELLNEPRGKWTDEQVWNNLHPVDYLGKWCHAAAIYLNGKGYKFCGPSFNSGEPGDDGKGLENAVVQYSQPGMLNYLQYCADNPDMAALATHEYIWGFPAPQYPGLWGRFEAAIAAADLAGIPRTFSIFVTEFGYSPNNAPTYPDVAPDLDTYNQICARFPQVKFAAAWTLQNGYDPVDDQVITWKDYPIDRDFDPGPQPAKTHTAFGGTSPTGEPMPNENLLYNPSFEGGHYNKDNVPELQFANGYEGTWNTDGEYVRPEFRVIPRNQIPTNEWPLFYVPPPPDDSSWHMVKIFKDGLPIRFQYKTEPGQFPLQIKNLPAGKYRYSFWIFPDIYTAVINGIKQWSDDPTACRIRLFWNGVQGDWQSLHPYGGTSPRQIIYEWQHSGGDAVFGFQVDCPKKNIHNGVVIDAEDLRKVEEPTMTWEQEAWKLGEQEKVLGFKTGAALQVQVTADGYQALSNEYEFTRPDGVKLVMQRAKHASEGTFRTYYVIPPNYGTIYIIDEATGNSPPNF